MKATPISDSAPLPYFERHTAKEVYLGLLMALDQKLKEKNSQKLYSPKNLTEVRALLFKLECFSRVMENYPKGKISKYFKGLKDLTKTIEDQIGAVLQPLDLKKQAKTASQKQYVTKSHSDQSKKLQSLLKSAQWLQGQGIESLYLEAENLPWPKESKIFQHTAHYLKDYTRKLRAELPRGPLHDLIFKDHYLYPSLEEGLHEVRRQLRWIAITLQTFEIYFTRDNPKSNWSKEEKSLFNKYKSSPYFALKGNTTLPYTLPIPPLAYARLNDDIERLGDLKDHGEVKYYLFPENFEFGKEPEAHAIFKQMMVKNYLAALEEAFT